MEAKLLGMKISVWELIELDAGVMTLKLRERII